MKLRTILALSILATIAGLIILALLNKFGWPGVLFWLGAAAMWWAIMTVVEDL